VNPYITFVVPDRNDDYNAGGLRLRSLCSGIIEQSNYFQLETEIVVIDWNPPVDKPSLAEEMRGWPIQTQGFCRVKVIEVPREIHQKYGTSGKLNLYVMMAYNVGIRRAAGKFVLPAPQDLTYSNRMFRKWAARLLDVGAMYRAVRHDVAAKGFPYSKSLAERLKFCKKNVALVCRSGHPPYTNASGDFILMSKEDWFDLRGWPEYDGYPVYLDGLVCHMAAVNRMEILLISEPFYHVQHKSFWSPTSKLDDLGLPYHSYERYGGLVQELHQGKRAVQFNGEDWGQAGEAFKEHAI
jgi:hypothetical protein